MHVYNQVKRKKMQKFTYVVNRIQNYIKIFYPQYVLAYEVFQT